MGILQPEILTDWFWAANLISFMIGRSFDWHYGITTKTLFVEHIRVS